MADSCEIDDDVDFDASWDDLFLDSASEPSSKANAVNTTSRHKESPTRSTTTAKEDNVVSASPTKSPAAYQPPAHSKAPSSNHEADVDHLDLWPSLSTTPSFGYTSPGKPQDERQSTSKPDLTTKSTATAMAEGSTRATNAMSTNVDSLSPPQSTRRTIDSFSQIARRKVTSARFTDVERLPSPPPTKPPTWPSPDLLEALSTTQSPPCVELPAAAVDFLVDLSETNDVVTAPTELDDLSPTCSRRREERDSPRAVSPTYRRASTNPFDDDLHAAHVDTSDDEDAVEPATLLQSATPPKKPTLQPPMALDQEQTPVSADDDEVSWKQFVMDEALMSSVKEAMELETSPVSMDLHDENNSSPELTPRRVDATPGKISLEESKRQDLWHTLRQGSIAIAPIKRNATVAAMEPSAVLPIESTPPSLTLLHSLDQKLASFESYLGENKALKTDLDKANQTIAGQETHIKALERDAQAFQETIQALQHQLEAARATQEAQNQAEHDVATYAAKCLRWETFALVQRQRRDRVEILSTVWRAWLMSRHGGRTAKLRAAARLAHFAATRRAAQQDLRQALHHLRHASALQVGTHEAKQARRMSLEYRRHTRETAVRCALLLLAGCWRRHEQHALHHAFCHWKSTDQATTAKRNALDRGCAKLQTWHSLFWTAKKRLALVRWRHYMTTASDFALVASAAMQKDDFEQAKACIFDLTKTTSQLKEANAALSIQVAAHDETLHQLRTELQLTKHGFVATILRRLDIESARGWFHAWRESIQVEKATKSIQATVCELEMQLDERERFTKSLDAYNKVLQADLDRFQYVTQDTRLAVDVLTKKLLREEAKSVALAAERAALDAQFQALCWIDGVPGDTDDDNQPLECPLEVLHVSKAWMVDRLAQVFAIHADKVVQANAAPVYVMSWENCFELVQSTLSHATSSPPPPPSTGATAGNESKQINLSDGMDMLSQLESFFPPPPITFRAFMTGVAAFLSHMHEQTTDENVRASIANFWRALLDSTGDDSTVNAAAAVASATSWTRKNQLSDEILQNQEKLLAVLEHETAVVERAVLDKASLKHTYSSDPLAALETPQPPQQTPVLVDCNWLDLPQVRDLIMSYELPLAQLYAKYAVNHPSLLPPPQNAFERHLDAVRQRAMAPGTAHVSLTLQGVLKLFEDLKLFPTVFPPEVVARLFIDVANATDSSTSSSPPPTLSFPGFIKLFGSCILTTFENHSPPLAMSIRERLHTFLSDVHCLTTTAVRPAKPCVVGQELEAILWPLFEYYSSGGGGGGHDLDETRLTMTSMKFCRFMHEIAGMDKERGRANAELMFRKAVRVSRGTSLASRMVFDEFYMGIYYMHQLRDSTKRYDTPGDALREWMQQL
ncbi:hypothetical protein AeNC1_000223 [Aphanomyces euteiches]|nr:hypothetical protein AeNC1_000223 [Aphanomyces euteiches]